MALTHAHESSLHTKSNHLFATPSHSFDPKRDTIIGKKAPPHPKKLESFDGADPSFVLAKKKTIDPTSTTAVLGG